MQTYIALLRGINVGGHNPLKMDELKKLFISLSFTNITTIIQSGNIIFSTAKVNTDILNNEITAAIKEQFNFAVGCVVLTIQEFTEMVKHNVFVKDKPIETLHVTLLQRLPQKEKSKALNNFPKTDVEFNLINKAVYLFCPQSYSSNKLTNTVLEKVLGVQATTRNWKTILRLLEIANNN
jgi:uncharacterized protein (DUF1697 family)